MHGPLTGPRVLSIHQRFLRFGYPLRGASAKRQRTLDDKPRLKPVCRVSMLNAHERSEYMDTEDVTELAEAILEEYDRGMFDDELEVLP